MAELESAIKRYQAQWKADGGKKGTGETLVGYSIKNDKARQKKEKDKKLMGGSGVSSEVEKRANPADKHRYDASSRRANQMQALQAESAGKVQQGEDMLRALRDTGPSLAEFAGNRKKNQAMQALSQQEAKHRGSSPALAALLGGRQQAVQAGNMAENIAGDRSAEYEGMSGALARSIDQRRKNAMSMYGANTNYGNSLGDQEKEFNNQLLQEALQRKLMNEQGLNNVDMAGINKQTRPEWYETALQAGGQIGGVIASAYQPNDTDTPWANEKPPQYEATGPARQYGSPDNYYPGGRMR